ncbi:hypothetical protein G6F31_014739 [Rhizopus arrhizus]|nr:hypothetical protein G6F31_014739 [Rhizopus arrhizus]
MGEFGATLMVAGSIPGRTQTLSIAIYEAVQAGQDGKANALVILTSVVCIVILLLAARLVGATAPAGGRTGFRVGRVAAVHAAAGGAVRALGRGQEPDIEGGGRAAAARRGPCAPAGTDPVRCGNWRGPAAAASPAGLRVPGLCAVPAPERAPERGVRAAEGLVESTQQPALRCGGAVVACFPHRHGGRSAAIADIRWPAPAHRPGARPGDPAAGVAAGRTVFRAGPRPAPASAPGTGNGAGQDRHPVAADQPRPAGRGRVRPAGGPRGGRPHRRQLTRDGSAGRWPATTESGAAGQRPPLP